MGLIQVAHAYDVELYAAERERAAKVRIGGNAASVGDKFVPNINMSKWDDEHWINLNFPIAIANQVETFDGEKVSITVGDYSFVYYPKQDNFLEFEIVFGKRPPISVFELDIICSNGLNFYYQPPLTQEEIDDGCGMPENVVGSYAVYCRKGFNKYETGKFCHIYYPYLQDADGKRTRVEGFEIINGKMRITLPAAWMFAARYPVTLDPEFGYHSNGASNDSTSNYYLHTSALDDAPSTGVTDYLYVYSSKAAGATDDFKVGLYDDSAGPANKVGSEVLNADAGTWALTWKQFVMGSINVVAATNYWPTVQGESTTNSIVFYYDATAGVTNYYRHWAASFAAAWPAVHGKHESLQRKYSFYVEYTATGGGGSKVPLIMAQMNQFGGGAR